MYGALVWCQVLSMRTNGGVEVILELVVLAIDRNAPMGNSQVELV